MADQRLPKGIRLFPKNEKAPDFVIASMVVTLEDLKEFFNQNQDLLTEFNGKKQLKLQILNSKEGKPYAAVDTFKPTPKVQNRNVEVIELESDLPF
jgi:hypothetical protein